jgi:hypothetical protein
VPIQAVPPYTSPGRSGNNPRIILADTIGLTIIPRIQRGTIRSSLTGSIKKVTRIARRRTMVIHDTICLGRDNPDMMSISQTRSWTSASHQLVTAVVECTTPPTRNALTMGNPSLWRKCMPQEKDWLIKLIERTIIGCHAQRTLIRSSV